MGNPFLGQSKATQQAALLKTLEEIANLRADSRRYRELISTVRSGLKHFQTQLEQIQEALTIENVLAFPVAVKEEAPQPKRRLGRWGAVRYTTDAEEAVVNPSRDRDEVPRLQRASGTLNKLSRG
jgi:hypothetical protein